MIHIILYTPEIPGNTGNIIRLCANTGAQLHLIKPLGFSLEDKQLRRAGLDYHEYAHLNIWENFEDCLAYLAQTCAIGITQIFPITTKGKSLPFTANLSGNIALLFGAETSGLPEAVRALFPTQNWLRLPMLPDSRSLNLSNAAAIMIYAAWQQQGFAGALTD